jgi:hypothetical protein
MPYYIDALCPDAGKLLFEEAVKLFFSEAASKEEVGECSSPILKL